MAKVLLIDDEKTILDNLKFILELEGYEIIAASDGVKGISLFNENTGIDVVVTDMKMPELGGLDVMEAIHGIDPDIGIIVLTGNGDMENAVQAMREGAFDYLNKPVNADKLILCIENALKKLNLIRENRKLNEDIMRQNAFFQDINNSAQQILLKMLPEKVPEFDSLKMSVIYKSCDNVGGDMYDIFEIDDKIIFYIFDVCGHGILSAVMTMILKSSFSSMRFLYNRSGIIPNLEEVVEHINREMYTNTASHLFATLFAGVYYKKTQWLTYISAGHVDQYLITQNGLDPLFSTGTVIGIFPDVHYNSKTVKINPGDRLYLFTDGITEIWRDNIIVTTDEIVRIVTENTEKSLDENVSMIYNNLIRLYSDKKPDDDITLVGIEFNAPEADCEFHG